MGGYLDLCAVEEEGGEEEEEEVNTCMCMYASTSSSASSSSVVSELWAPGPPCAKQNTSMLDEYGSADEERCVGAFVCLSVCNGVVDYVCLVLRWRRRYRYRHRWLDG